MSGRGTVLPLDSRFANLIEYHPNWIGRKFFVDQNHWDGEIRAWVERVEKWLTRQKFSFDVTGHPTERRDGIRFGSINADYDALVASTLCIPVFDDKTLESFDQEPEQPKLDDMPKSTTGRGRPKKAAALGVYPLTKLRRLGDSMLIKISPTSESSLRRFISDTNNSGTRKYATHKSVRGILVVLTEGPVPDPIEVFEEDPS